MAPATTPTTLAALSGPPAGAHAAHDLVLEVLEGVVYLVTDEDERALTPGDVARVPAGTPHRYWNAGDEEAGVRASLVPPPPAPAERAAARTRLLSPLGRARPAPVTA